MSNWKNNSNQNCKSNESSYVNIFNMATILKQWNDDNDRSGKACLENCFQMLRSQSGNMGRVGKVGGLGGWGTFQHVTHVTKLVKWLYFTLTANPGSVVRKQEDGIPAVKKNRFVCIAQHKMLKKTLLLVKQWKVGQRGKISRGLAFPTCCAFG